MIFLLIVLISMDVNWLYLGKIPSKGQHLPLERPVEMEAMAAQECGAERAWRCWRSIYDCGNTPLNKNAVEARRSEPGESRIVIAIDSAKQAHATQQKVIWNALRLLNTPDT